LLSVTGIRAAKLLPEISFLLVSGESGRCQLRQLIFSESFLSLQKLLFRAAATALGMLQYLTQRHATKFLFADQTKLRVVALVSVRPIYGYMGY
jgi:hypothetical protein